MTTVVKPAWDTVYTQKMDAELGWFEQDQTQTLELLEQVGSLKGLDVFVAGAGTSALVEELLKLGSKPVCNDLSEVALTQLQNRLGSASAHCTWWAGDLSQDLGLPQVDVWTDRAVLHFLQTEEELQGYFNNLKSSLRFGGWALFQEFRKGGALKCNGLPVKHWDTQMLQLALGDDFECVESTEFDFINPRGEPRPYMSALFRRVKN